jgi:hypothetical protein
MCIFSEYKNIFGKMGKGVHKIRFLNTAMVDYCMTILFAMLVTYVTDIPLVITTLVLLLLGIFFHYIFGVETNTLKYLGFVGC